MDRKAYGYKDDPAIPAFDDTHPLLVFDGKCVLCSGGAAKMMQWDKEEKFRYATAQSKTGNALLRYYGCDSETFNTVLVVSNGHGYFKSDGYIEIARLLGGLWYPVMLMRFIPKFIRDALYDWKARNRYNWFGKTEYCKLLPHKFDRLIIDR